MHQIMKEGKPWGEPMDTERTREALRVLGEFAERMRWDMAYHAVPPLPPRTAPEPAPSPRAVDSVAPPRQMTEATRATLERVNRARVATGYGDHLINLD